MYILNPFVFTVVPSKVRLFILYTQYTANTFLYYAHYVHCTLYAYSTCLTFDITSGYTQLFSLLLDIAFSFFVTNNVVGNGLEPEQMIEIVDSTNNLVGYVSGTLPDTNLQMQIQMITL